MRAIVDVSEYTELTILEARKFPSNEY